LSEIGGEENRGSPRIPNTFASLKQESIPDTITSRAESKKTGATNPRSFQTTKAGKSRKARQNQHTKKQLNLHRQN
jgi:hypothetical protein